MCFAPKTLQKVSTGAQIGGGVINVLGRLATARAQQEQSETSARIAESNAALAREQAQDAISRGRTAEARTQSSARRLKGKQQAEFASRGIDLGSDIVSEILLETDIAAESDTLTLRANAEREANALLINAENFQETAQLQRQAGSDARRAGLFRSFDTVLTTAGAVADKWYRFKKQRVPSTRRR